MEQIFILITIIFLVTIILLIERLHSVKTKLNKKVEDLSAEVNSLSQFSDVRDASIELDRLKSEILTREHDCQQQITELLERAANESKSIIDKAQLEVDVLRRDTNADTKSKRERASALLTEANAQADIIINKAKESAEEIAGDAYRALKEADRLEGVIQALKNVINGYGDEYMKPTYGLLDELAEMYAFDDAGKELKLARERTKLLVTSERAATCDYVEKGRAKTAINFVIDAFNGKVDSILSRSKTDNFGKLEAEIRDAASLVNQNGKAFRNAQITEEYLTSRIDELHWATAVNTIRENEREEQRRIRDQIREEQKAQREFERAIKDAAKEEAAIQKAVSKLLTQLEKATEDQRAEYEQKLSELQGKLTEAEARNQRALSMAQQTRTGHVYVISNVGSFGENIYKVGMTRRLEPLDRVRELGDASVPFPFDVHAMIWSEDAPALERDLHRYFLRAQMNKINPRKEFFKIDISKIKTHVEERGHKCSWTLTAAATQYRETLEIEKKIESDASVANEWMRHQLEYEPIFSDAEEELE
ncbi:DUF4041 domain-containing protein [Rheinheimera sp. UJ51]|uniref:DUF4041 domain-containing protein n=1 Tax=Rheinheimera sp. UJ51 TaxID=2892446 RepID=UPI001E31557D|nr:DUF4041 domain-containing protein [Rheinheimera sp. UJ51]MCC5450722.1 DUF4041 domain-containing protein [Rheinheimera sp. UJ51]